jgi:hypothetical protein
VWPLTHTGQTGQTKVLKISIGLNHCIDLVEKIEMHMWNVQFWVWMRELWSWQEPALRMTGLTGGPVEPNGLAGARSQIWFRCWISMWNWYRLRLLLGQDLPTLYLWMLTSDWGEHNRIYQLHLLFTLSTPFSNLHASHLLISTILDGILGPAGLPRARRRCPRPSGVPLGRELRRPLLVCS